MIIKTAKGKTIECDSVVQGQQFSGTIHINTHSITPIEAYQIFGDPEETEVLIAEKEGEEPREFKGYTDIYSVQKSPFYIQYPNEILIWLNRP